MSKDQFNPNNLPQQQEKFMTELETRELIAAALANYTGVVRFRNVVTTDVNIGDFTNAQHTHSNAAGGGQLNPANIFTTSVPVPSGGTGANSLTGIVYGNGASAFTAANISGIVKANGASIPTVAAQGTDYYAPGGTDVSVADGGTGVSTVTGILKGNGASAFSAITPLAGTKVYYVSDTSGGAITRKLTFTDGVLTGET